MATVYLARLSGAGGFQRFVAIKRLHPHLAGDQEFVQMFLDEARLAARLHHPNVVPILEIGESPQGYYLVMEYVEGDTLARILARSAQAGRMLPPKVSMRICVDSITGLHVAHEMKDDDQKPLNIVHRDVSPQNILIGMDGVRAHHGLWRRARNDAPVDHTNGAAQRQARIHGAGAGARYRRRSARGRLRDGHRHLGDASLRNVSSRAKARLTRSTAFSTSPSHRASSPIPMCRPRSRPS